MVETQSWVWLPSLRRYLTAYIGSSEDADALIMQFVEAMPAACSGSRGEVFAAFHRAVDWRGATVRPASNDWLAESLGQLMPFYRSVFLLVVLERFECSQVAQILDRHPAETAAALRLARQALPKRLSARILIIEDEAVVGLDICGILTAMGHEVCGIASNRAEAVARARSTHPDLVLADIRLADGDDGIAAVEEILQYGEVPIIFVTAYGHELIVRQGVKPAMVLGKPFPKRTLQVAVDQALQSRRLHAVGL